MLRVPLESGFYLHHRFPGSQVVSRQLYIVLGTSVGIRHRAGDDDRRGAGRPKAPFFEIVDCGVVGGRFTVISPIAAEVIQPTADPERNRAR